MSTSILNPRLLATGLLCVCAGVAQAAAVLVNFESAPPLTVVGPGQTDASYTESGVIFTPTTSDAIVDASFCLRGFGSPNSESCITSLDATPGIDDPAVYLMALNGTSVEITMQHAFTLNNLDAAFLPAPDPKGYFAGLSLGLKLVGTLWDGGTVEATLSLLEHPTFDGDFIFSTYDGLGSAWLRSVSLSSCLITGLDCVRGGTDFDNAGLLVNDMQFAIDNLTLTIPEPSALWLVTLSLSGLAFARRRSAR